MDVDDEVILDYVLQFLECPLFTTPMRNFVDKNCNIFSDVEENKIEYTLIHKEYNTLIESILENNIQSLGIDMTTFFLVCNRGIALQDVLFNAFLAMEDFLLFKQMMIARQRKLYVDSLKAEARLKQKKMQQRKLYKERYANMMKIVEEEERLQMNLAQKVNDKVCDLDQRKRDKLLADEERLIQDAILASQLSEELRIAELAKKEAEIQENMLMTIKVEKDKVDKSSTDNKELISELNEMDNILRNLPPLKMKKTPLKRAKCVLPDIVKKPIILSGLDFSDAYTEEELKLELELEQEDASVFDIEAQIIETSRLEREEEMLKYQTHIDIKPDHTLRDVFSATPKKAKLGFVIPQNMLNKLKIQMEELTSIRNEQENK